MKKWTAVAAVALLGSAAWISKGKLSVDKTLDVVKVRIGTKKTIPDPANIETTGDWYFLDHVSSGLFSYDHEQNVFVPNIAEKWSIGADNVHVFKLRKDLKFSDGSPITPADVEASIKRILVKKTSTHLPLWQYVADCENLKSIEDSCPGIKLNNESDLEIRLKNRSESFFLQLASPETGIWAKTDINPQDLSIHPTKFSGPYLVKNSTSQGFLLERNEQSQISKKFPNSPRKIELITIPLADAEKAMLQGELDLVLRSHNPFGEPDLFKTNISVHKTAPATIIYFHSVHHDKTMKLIGQDFMNALWGQRADEAIPAETFLPFASKYSLSKGEFLSHLPQKSAKLIRIGKPWNFYSDAFIQRLSDSAKQIGVDLQIVDMTPAEWSAAFEDPKVSSKIDFILTPYVASDRYPAVQLRFITGQMKHPPIDLIKAETPDLTDEKVEVLRNYQQWLLETQSAVPLFFTRVQIYHRADIDVGAQSNTDGEIELWRLTKRSL